MTKVRDTSSTKHTITVTNNGRVVTKTVDLTPAYTIWYDPNTGASTVFYVLWEDGSQVLWADGTPVEWATA